MIASVFIIVFSLALLVYWFRYSCILLLRNRAEEAASSTVTTPFAFGEMQADAPLDAVHASLMRDFKVLTYLIEHASGLQLESIEDRLLVWDYKVMRCWYGITKIIAPVQARQALREMASVLSVLAGKLDERASAHSGASVRLPLSGHVG